MPEPVTTLDLSALPDEVKEAVEKTIADLTKRAEESEAEVALLKEKDPDADEILKNADPAIRKMVEDAQAEAAEATNIAKAEREARIKREFVTKAESLPFVPGETEAKADLMKAAFESLTPEQYQELEKILSSTNDLISKSKALSVIGSGQVDEDSPEGRLEKLAKARASEKSISIEKATDEVLAENPDLYDEMGAS